MFVPARPAQPSTNVAGITVANPPAPVADEASVPPQFTLGYSILKAQLGDRMGDPLEAAHGTGHECDTQQLTTTGLAYLRCSTGVTSFAADPDGQQHWALTPAGVVAWTGPDLDPPQTASLLSPASDPQSAGCLAPVDAAAAQCLLADGSDISARLVTSGAMNAYRFNVTAPQSEVIADLTELPADYDLYLVDTAGNLLDQSVHEGTTPERVDRLVPGGSYVLYVQADPSRPVDPDDPYRLHLTLSSQTGAASPSQAGPDLAPAADGGP